MKRFFLLLIILLSLSIALLYAQQADSIHVFMDSVLVRLPEVMVKGERPVVKVEEGKLKYDVPRLVQDKAVTNAFEAVKEIPGVISRNENDLSLAGSDNLHIIINGQLSTMSYEQLISLLKSLPASNVAKAEVMYSAPPQYNVRGALINPKTTMNYAHQQGSMKVLSDNRTVSLSFVYRFGGFKETTKERPDTSRFGR